ncbi:hypothetical protein CQW23_24365 [Capsicum baccatum]|uniref:Uncharacterized protein n=1 Tax=Capsicum baccatum TaxID=33114 RepID=A0A2G2VUL6_CAPBA|nr:hypothetical protein CQW23_24365 [Capsicum baccatum]
MQQLSYIHHSMSLPYKRYLNQEQNIMNTGKRNISKEMIKMLIALPPKSWSKPSALIVILDYGPFVAAYTEYLNDRLRVPNDGLDAGLLCKRYAALLCKYEEAKAQKPYATDVKNPRQPKLNSVAPDEEQLIHID